MNLPLKSKNTWLVIAILMATVAVVQVSADAVTGQWGPPVGKPLPVLEAHDHTGMLRTFDNLKGRRGLLLFMNRSADW